MENPSRYQKLVANAKRHISEITPAEAAAASRRGDAVLIEAGECRWRKQE